MDIRLLKGADIPQAKALWKEAFGDSDAFIDWYFANKILPGNSVGIFDGDLVSVVHMIPHRISVQKRPLQTSYIAGAATAKRRQGEGLMRTLLLESLKLMKERGIAITHLYPFKHSFYENFGWTTYSYVHEKTAREASVRKGDEVTETIDWEPLSSLYENMMQARDGYVVRGAREWRWRLEELWADGGIAALLLKDGRPSAYMLYYNGEEKAEAIETVCSSEEDIQPLLAHVLKSNKRVDYFIPSEEGQGSPYGMARIVDAEAFLSAFGVKDVLDNLRITDAFADWNNKGEGTEITQEQLAKLAHQGADTLRSKAVKEQCYSILKKVFLYRGTCIFEQY